MKYRPETYARALRETLAEAADKEKGNVVERFFALLKKTGDIARAGKVLSAVERLEVKSRGGRWVIVELARPAAEKTLAKITKLFTAQDHVEEKTNPSLIAGVRLTIDGEKEFDNSLQRKLKKLFKD